MSLGVPASLVYPLFLLGEQSVVQKIHYISRLSLRLHKLAHLFVVFVCLLVILCDSKGLYEKIKHAVTYICK